MSVPSAHWAGTGLPMLRMICRLSTSHPIVTGYDLSIGSYTDHICNHLWSACEACWWVQLNEEPFIPLLPLGLSPILASAPDFGAGPRSLTCNRGRLPPVVKSGGRTCSALMSHCRTLAFKGGAGALEMEISPRHLIYWPYCLSIVAVINTVGSCKLQLCLVFCLFTYGWNAVVLDQALMRYLLLLLVERKLVVKWWVIIFGSRFSHDWISQSRKSAPNRALPRKRSAGVQSCLR